MSLGTAVKQLFTASPLWTILAEARFWAGSSQSDEVAILDRLTKAVQHPKTFTEFGYHYSEFNCIGLAKSYSGLLIDGSEDNVARTRRIMPRRIRAEAAWLTLDNLGMVRDAFSPGTLGILSVDVDGNDYWFLKELLSIRPAIISVEYNASFRLEPVTVRYDPGFTRFDKHPSGLYHGASLTAFVKLCDGYDLVGTSNGGANAFFVRSDLRPDDIPQLSPEVAYRENSFRNAYNDTTASEQWDIIKNSDLIWV